MKILVLMVFIFNSFMFGLSNEVLADKYLITAKKYVKEKRYVKAVENFEKIFSLGIKVPNDLYYFYAKSLNKSGDIIKAYDNFNLYIEKAGRGSSHYQEALGFMVDLDDAIISKKKAIKERKYREKQEKQKRKREEKARIKREIERQKQLKLKKSHDLRLKARKILEKGENYKYAFSLYKESLKLNKNNKNTLCDIAYMYNYGLHVNKDKNIGFKYTKKSVENGYCYNNLGYAYEFGSGVKIDYKEAAKWYRKAIETGTELARSNYHLGVMLAEGKGFVVDYRAAKKKFELAQKNGDKQASKYLKKISKKVELEEMREKLKSYAVQNGYSDYPIETYIDPDSKLMWQSVKMKDDFYLGTGYLGEKSPAEKLLTYEEAKQYCRGLTLAGFSDWRLPSIRELLTVVNYEYLKSNDIEVMKNRLLTTKLLQDKEFKEFLKYGEMDYSNRLNNFGSGFIEGLYYVGIGYPYTIYWSHDKYVMNENSKWVLDTLGYETKSSNINNELSAICVRSQK